LPKRARAACADQPTLLVLDNFEHLLDAAPVVADLLTSVPSLRLLVTSRAPLHVRGEREYVVGPLALQAAADATSPADLARVPAVRLFVERVRDVRTRLSPDARERPDGGRDLSTARCAAARARTGRAVGQGAHTRRSAQPARARQPARGPRGAGDLPERQQTTHATVAWSYQLLGPEEQRASVAWASCRVCSPIDAAKAVLAGDEGVWHRRSSAPARRRFDRQEPASAIRDSGRGNRRCI
jgi:predicted ATPase